MKVIYISGPYRAEYRSQVFDNIMNARKAALLVWSQGGVALCPHLNTMFFGGAYGLPDETWLAGDLELISRVDALWVLPGWERSEGTQLEIKEAQRLNLPVFYSFNEVATWLKANKIWNGEE